MPNTTISSADVNSDFSDIATAITGSIAADGQTAITGVLKFPSGTAGAPSHSFSSDLTTGMYLSAVGRLGFAANGVAQVLINSDRSGVGEDGAILTYADGTILAPVGIVSSYAGTTAPAGWMFIYGQAISRTAYPELFTEISTTFGSGDGSTTFNLPDGRGRVDIGRDNMGGSAAGRITTAGSGIDGVTLGAVGGSQSVTLDATMIPSHTHTFTGFALSPHNHTYSYYTGVQTMAPGGGALGTSQTGGTTSADSAGTPSGVNSSTGGGLAHINAKPGIVFNKMIFAGRV